MMIELIFSKLTLNEGIVESNLEPLNRYIHQKLKQMLMDFQDTDCSQPEYDSNTGKMKIKFNNVSKNWFK